MSDLTKIHITENQKNSAIMSANRIVMSPHEWVWTQEEQQEMALVILWLCTENSKLSTKYNGVFEWAVNLYDRHFKGYSAEDLKEYYEESLNETPK